MDIKKIMEKKYVVNKGVAYLKHYGPEKLFRKALEKVLEKDGYTKNYAQNEVDEDELLRQRSEWFSYMPKISILVPVFDPPRQYLKEMLLSVLDQTYFNWQLCLVDAGNTKLEGFIKEVTGKDERVKYQKIENGGIAVNTNQALEMATGDYIALLDNDDVLALEALFRMVEIINKEKPDCLYSDEDKVNADLTKHFCPHIKPDFNMGLLQTNNYICHLFMVKKEIALAVGGFSPEYDGAQDFDFILKCVEKSRKVSHVNRVLYHWRTHEQSTSSNPLSKMYAYEAGKKALEAHLKRQRIQGRVEMLDDMGFYRIRYELKELPVVKVVVLGVRNNEDAQSYFKYIRNNTDYDHFSICAMKEVDIERLSSMECEYFAVLNPDMGLGSRRWLRNLMAVCSQERQMLQYLNFF